MYRSALIGILLSGCIAAPAQHSAPGTQAAQSTAAPDQQTPQEPTQASDDEAMAQAAHTAQATIRWDQSSTPGMKATMQFLDKRDAGGLLVSEYHVKVSGAPHNQVYTLMTWPIMLSGPVRLMDGLVVARDGTVGCPPDSTASCAKEFKGAELRLAYSPVKGEIFRHALVSDDQKSRIFFSLVPDPILTNDKACSLEVVRLSPLFELVLIRGRGFPPDETLRFHEQSYQEVHDLPVTANDEGEFQAQLTPKVKGRTTGTADVVVTSKTCAPTISFDWGQ